MKLYSYKGKQWVIRSEFAVNLGVNRHILERETQRPPFRRQVLVVKDAERKSFLKANAITRGGGTIALIEKSAAKEVAAKLSTLSSECAKKREELL